MAQTRTAPSTHANPVVVIGILALVCMTFMAYMLYRSNEREQAKNLQEYTECLNSSIYRGPGVDTCTARYKVGAY
jgi:hypothetical protein